MPPDSEQRALTARLLAVQQQNIDLRARLDREHQAGDGSNRDIFAAVEMIRRALGEFDEGTSYYHNTSTGERFDRVQPLASVGTALEVLRRHGIVIDLSGPMRPR